MPEKKMLIVDAETARKIDENRGDMTRSDFVSFVIDSCLKEDSVNHNFVTKEEFKEFEYGTRELLRSFLEFFISYGLELGKQPKDETFAELSQKLQALGSVAKKKL
jgi:hypothetical protein